MTITAFKPGSPRLPKAAASTLTEQAARYKRLLGRIADMRRTGATAATVRLADLEALVAIAASTDAGVASTSKPLAGLRALVAAAEEAGWDIGPNAGALSAARNALALAAGAA